MQKLIEFSKKAFIASVIFVQVLAWPATILAQEATSPPPTADSGASTSSSEAPAPAPEPALEVTPVPEITSVSPPPPAESTATAPLEPSPALASSEAKVNGPTSPPGPANNTYSLNTATGLWENDYYTWDPITKQTKPKVAQTYSFNPITQMWDTTEWYYRPEVGRYAPNTVSYAVSPINLLQGSGGANYSIGNTGPGSTNAILDSSGLQGSFDLFFDSRISNRMNSIALSGNALVQGNTNGGNATSGDAMVISNILNMLQSSWFGQSSDISTFVANLDGSVFGDLYIDPNNLPTSGLPPNANLDITVANNGVIDNNVTLTAGSGNAAVTENTNAGNATSGNAVAIANIFNLINSAIVANRSFLGILNINGSLNGDILLPPALRQGLIAATGPNSNNQISREQDSSLNVTADTNRSIINDITTNAGSGNASVDQNTTAGSAASGAAETNVNTLNLIGRDVTADNGLLVFVNVLGSWVGFLLNAPAGSSSIATTGPNSNNTITTDGRRSISVDAAENSLINNNVIVNAQSGDASLTKNTNAGNASSGDASATVNILNMINSRLAVSDWFGVLFINVFGSWDGSFGIDTPSGDTAATANPPSNSNSQGNALQSLPAATGQENRDQQRTGFGTAGNNHQIGTGGTVQSSEPVPAVIGSATTSGGNKNATSPTGKSSQAMSDFQFWMLALAAAALTGSLLFVDRLLALARKVALLTMLRRTS